MDEIEFFLKYPDYDSIDHAEAAQRLMELRVVAKSKGCYGAESIYWNEAMKHHNMALTLAPKSGININEEF